VPAPTESSYAPPATGAGPPFRVLQFTTLLAGVPTVVDVEGIVLVDSDGRVVFRPAGDQSEMLSLILRELRLLRMQLASLTGLTAEVNPHDIGG
jgi:hypothetical protein